jgi:hypothetical protein
MAKYYNKNSGPLAVSLKSGAPACLPGKAWTEIPPEEEGSEDLIQNVKKGFLTRFDNSVADPQPVEKAQPVAKKMEAAPAVEAKVPAAVMSPATMPEEKPVMAKGRKTPDKQEG